MWLRPIITPSNTEALKESGVVGRSDSTRRRVKAVVLRWLRLRAWAKAALKQFDLRGARFALLKEGNNERKLLFRIDSPTQGRFVLRMYKVSRRSENLMPELLWLQALRREMPLSVPEPIPAPDGSLISEVTVKGTSRRCVLLRWLPGDRKPNPSSEDLAMAGSRVARLHRHCEQYGLPEGLVFPHVWDWDWVFGDAVPIWNKGGSVYSRSELDVFRTTAERVRQDLQDLGKDISVFGIIHRDLHLNNFLFRNEDAYVVDFEMCGWGYYLFDLAVTLLSLEGRKHPTPLQYALLEGYQRERPLPEEQLRYIDTFVAMRIVQKVNMILHWEDHSRQSSNDRQLMGSVRGLKEFVASKSKAGQIDLSSPWWRRAYRRQQNFSIDSL
jgi:Ser/Thr protein kinase RdoA (MazF antagonist)